MIHYTQDGIRWHLQEDMEALLQPLLAGKGRVVKESPAKLVSVVEVGGRTFYVKRYRHSAVPLRPLKFFFKRSQAHAEWEVARRLESLGIPAVRHVALGERWSATGLNESILITEGFDGVPLDQRSDFVPAAVLAFVERMHQAGVLQADLHPGNILVGKDPTEMRLVDLHGIDE